MTADKLLQTLKEIVNLDSSLSLQTTVEQIRDALVTLTGSPASAPHQTQLGNALQALQNASDSLRSTLTPSQIDAIASLGGNEFFSPEIAQQVKGVISANAMTPSVAKDFVQSLASRRSEFLKTVQTTLTGLEGLLSHGKERPRLPADISFLVPRQLFDNRLDEFTKELRFINLLIEHFSEAITGTPESPQLETLASSDPTVILNTAISVIGTLASAVTAFLAAWEKIDKMRRMRTELAEMAVSAKALDELTERVNSNIESVVEEVATKAIAAFPLKDQGRKTELHAFIKNDLRKLYIQIERGLVVEFRVDPAQEPDEPEAQTAFKSIESISNTIRFPKALEQPMLLSDGDILDPDTLIAAFAEPEEIPAQPAAKATKRTRPKIGKRRMMPVSTDSPWKLWALRILLGGLGVGAGLGIVVAISIWMLDRPKGWDTRALQPHHVTVAGIGHAKDNGPRLDVDSIGTEFTFDLENTTSEDITLPKSVRVMLSDKNSGSLADSTLVLQKDYFLPAKHTVSINLENANECVATMKTDACFDSFFKDMGEIVIFDQPAKREIKLPIPPFKATKDGEPEFISTD